jgi:hypothetical protein
VNTRDKAKLLLFSNVASLQKDMTLLLLGNLVVAPHPLARGDLDDVVANMLYVSDLGATHCVVLAPHVDTAATSRTPCQRTNLGTRMTKNVMVGGGEWRWRGEQSRHERWGGLEPAGASRSRWGQAEVATAGSR